MKSILSMTEKLTLLFQKGDFAAGEHIALQILDQDPQNPYAIHFLGLNAYHNGDLNAAIINIKRSTELLPNNANFYCNLGEVYRKKEAFSDAIVCYKKALSLNPEIVAGYYNLGILYQTINDNEKAIENYKNCIRYQSNHLDALYNLNLAFQAIGKYVDAINCCQEIIRLNIRNHKAWNDMGVAYHKLGKYSVAEQCFNTSLVIEPSSALAHENRAVIWLLKGDYQKGFLEYQWFRKKEWKKSLSLTDDISGKNLFIYSERGYGDVIQFARYVLMLKKRNARVIFNIPRGLFRLFSLSHIADEYLINTNEEIPEFDISSGIMFLPCFFKTSLQTIPSDPYLKAPEKIKRLLRETIRDNQKGFNIGIIWAGNPKNENDIHRSASLDCFFPIARLPGVRLFSFQKDNIHRKELENLDEDVSIIDLGALFEDFADTASAIEKMDLMICVETSVAHLSGALGHKTWLLLPKIPDWRWLEDTKESPWYKEMRLFRQKSAGNWQDVIENVKITLQPIICEHLYQQGLSLINQKHYSLAFQFFEPITQINPDHFDAWFQMGNAFMMQKYINQAIEYYEKAVLIQPNNPRFQYNLGLAWYSKRDYLKAIKYFQAAFDQDQTYFKAIYNLGSAYYRIREMDKSIESFRKALTLDPEQMDVYTNIGACFGKQGDLETAMSWHQKAIDLSPDYADAHYNMGISMLLSGRLQEGFQKYEWRLKRPDFPKPKYDKPMWDGCAFNGQTLLVYMEQGFGDAIQFIRYLPQVKARGGTVILICHPSLQRLFETVQGVDHIIPENYQLPSFDYHISLMSLPNIFQTKLETIPSETPYLSLPYEVPKILDEIINKHGKNFNIGFVWAGNPANKHDQDRSIPQYMFSVIMTAQNIRMFSLQKQTVPSDADLLFDYIDLAPHLNDFSDTAYAISKMDLIISVDTAVAHLAGALNRPVWILLPKTPDWRWLLNRNDSPWYMSVKLFRQQVDGLWTDVFIQVIQELNNLIDNPDTNILSKSLSPTPYLADQLLKQGNYFFRNKQLEEAIQKYKESLSIQPDCVEVLYNLSVAYLELNQPDKSIDWLKKVVELEPNHDQAYNNLGIACQKLGQKKRAIDYLKKAIDCNPKSIRSLYNIGNAFKNEKQFEKAVTYYQKAISIQPDFAECLNNLADVYIYMKRYDDAMKLIDQALDKCADFPEFYFNKGVIFSRLGEYESAITFLRKAIAMRPDFIDAHYSLCFCLLVLGNLKEGFREHEWRIAKRPEHHNYGLKRWKGESFDGKKLLVYSEQGYGDCIHFARYLPLIKKGTGNIVFGCNPELYPLFENLAGADYVIKEGDNFPACDLQVSVISLPFLCQTEMSSIPANIPYVFCKKTEHSPIDPAIKPYKNKFCIGIAWAGNPTHKNDSERSIPYQLFKRLNDVENGQVFSFQKKGFSQTCEQMNWIDLGVYFDDFSDTAYAAKQMDLIITVDTSVAHLTGAMGLPTWVLIPPVPDWRWFTNRDDSPWYPTLRLFRREKSQRWENVFDCVIYEILKMNQNLS
ncbi:glycosyltransferase [Candidatus Magnetomorum sp. HK-1]|nr:glycosyltransferase [Candidatus Magnetomorum sp. HK-1]